MIKSLLTIIFLLSTQLAIGTEVYRMVDENGRVVYSQIPPYKDAEKLKLKSSGADTNSTTSNSDLSLQERQQRYSDYLESERLERKQKRDEEKQKKAELVANCHSVRAELSDMNQGGVLYYDLDENGERVYIDESRVEAKKQRLKKYLNRNCKNFAEN